MKSFVRFGVLGAFIALAAALGVVTSFSATTTVDAQIPVGLTVAKVCGAGSPTPTVATGTTITCVVTVTNGTGAALVVPGPITVAVTGTPGNAAILLNGTSGATGADVTGVTISNVVGQPQTITATCFTSATTCTLAPGVAGAITFTETLFGNSVGTTVESIKFGANAAQIITPSPAVVVPPAPPVTKACTTAGTTVNCTLTITTFNFLFPGTVITVTIGGNAVINTATPPTVTAANPVGLPPGFANCTAVITPGSVTATSFSITTGASGCFGGSTFQVTETLTAVTPGGGPLTQTISGPLGFNPAVVTVTATAPGGGAFTLPIVAPAPTGAPFTTVITDPCTLGATFTGATVASITPGQTITCRYDLSDNEPGTIAAGAAGTCNAAGAAAILASQCVSSGLINFSIVASPAGLTITGVTTNNAIVSPVAGIGTTAVSFRCPLGGPVAINSCDFFDVTFASAVGGALANNITVNVVYDPDVDAQNTPAIANFAGQFSIIQAVAGFVQPAGLGITCTTAIAGPFTGPFPGPIGNVNVVAIGILPASIACQVFPVNAAGVAIIAAPGTIEVTSLAGTLLTSNGQLTTNLRISCGGPTAIAVIGALIDVNNCQGVQFQILGLGVGFVDIKARYEPTTAAAAAGIVEVEGNANVAFVAPTVTVSLLLSPNPVVVGATGTATARFNRNFNCALAFGATVAGGTACIDPTTGLPIAITFGSALNGSVVFTIDNTAIASFVDAVTSTPVALPQVSGFTGTAAQVIKRCGFFPTTGSPATGVPGLNPFGPIAGPLANFFGGCDSADARYRGNIAGVAQVTATFVPDLPGAFGTNLVGLNQNVSALLGLFSGSAQPFQTRTLEVVAAAPVGTVQLARGCNNVSPTVTEAASAYAARVTPQGALVAIWEHQAATNTFRGFSPMAGAPNDLAGVTRLRPVFVCVSAAATLDQPAA